MPGCAGAQGVEIVGFEQEVAIRLNARRLRRVEFERDEIVIERAFVFDLIAFPHQPETLITGMPSYAH